MHIDALVIVCSLGFFGGSGLAVALSIFLWFAFARSASFSTAFAGAPLQVLELAQDGGFSEVRDLWNFTRYIRAVLAIAMLFSNLGTCLADVQFHVLVRGVALELSIGDHP